MATGLDEIHVPVLLDRTVALLSPALQRAVDSGRTPYYLDATLGLAGHALAVAAAVPEAHIVGIDRDQEALVLASKRLAGLRGRVHLAHGVFDGIAEVLRGAGIPAVDAVLMDLGVSSLQLDRADRGFAYSRDTPLDMRMDSGSGVTAADIVNGYSAKELSRVFRTYGEERFASRIAATIERERTLAPILSSARLADLVRDCVPAPARRSGGHPAKRVFQALRIEVNDELGALRRALPAALEALRPGGRLVVLSYQSLEDRIVKQTLAEATTSIAPPDLPTVPPELQPDFVLLTRGAEKAADEEISRNPRATSVRLRAVERIGAAG